MNLAAKCTGGRGLGAALDFYGALRSRTYDAHILEVLMRVPQSKPSPYFAKYHKRCCRVLADILILGGAQCVIFVHTTRCKWMFPGELWVMRIFWEIHYKWRLFIEVPCLLHQWIYWTLFTSDIYKFQVQGLYWTLYFVPHVFLIPPEWPPLPDLNGSGAIGYHILSNMVPYGKTVCSFLNLLIHVLLQWVDEIGGAEKLGQKLLQRKKEEPLPTFVAPKVGLYWHHFLQLCYLLPDFVWPKHLDTLWMTWMLSSGGLVICWSSRIRANKW